jgi:hypothetical protein
MVTICCFVTQSSQFWTLTYDKSTSSLDCDTEYFNNPHIIHPVSPNAWNSVQGLRLQIFPWHFPKPLHWSNPPLRFRLKVFLHNLNNYAVEYRNNTLKHTSMLLTSQLFRPKYLHGWVTIGSRKGYRVPHKNHSTCKRKSSWADGVPTAGISCRATYF